MLTSSFCCRTRSSNDFTASRTRGDEAVSTIFYHALEPISIFDPRNRGSHGAEHLHPVRPLGVLLHKLLQTGRQRFPRFHRHRQLLMRQGDQNEPGVRRVAQHIAVLHFRPCKSFVIVMACSHNAVVLRRIGLDKDLARQLVPARSARHLCHQLERFFPPSGNPADSEPYPQQ